MSCSAYNNNTCLTLVLIFSDTTFVVRDGIETYSDSCYRLFWHFIRFVLAITEYKTVIKKFVLFLFRSFYCQKSNGAIGI
jgi:hypothetical protein